jgi:hypothetical protein
VLFYKKIIHHRSALLEWYLRCFAPSLFQLQHCNKH